MTYQLPSKLVPTIQCPVCTESANKVFEDAFVATLYDCSRCGDFAITREALDELPVTLHGENRRALASHFIRLLQDTSTNLARVRPSLRADFFKSLAARSLPLPNEATDNLLKWLSEQASGRPGKTIAVTILDVALQAIVGVVDDQDVDWTLQNLVQLGYIDLAQRAMGISYSANLTGKGWQHVEEMAKAHIASRYAFFARRFQNSDLDSVVEHCLKDAVARTGFELRVVTQRAGLIDAIIEDEIRRCRLLIADLSDDNAGAYWEAGFAEGLGKPVIYLCRQTDSNDTSREKRTHFDTDHRHTVRWANDPKTFADTATKLKAVIRNTLLGEAKQDD